MTSNKCCLFFPDLRELLEKIDLAKYFSVFQEQEVIDYVNKFPFFAVTATITCSFIWFASHECNNLAIQDRVSPN